MVIKHADVEVDIKPGDTKAVIEGKTSVPFKKFIALILQRKVTTLFKDWGEAPVIVNSELLTGLASAPQDSQENKSQLILVTLGVGVLVGIFASAITQIILISFGIAVGLKELMMVAGGLVALAILANILGRIQRKKRPERIVEAMERAAKLLSK